MSDTDELVSQFMAFSGSSDVDAAKNYLEMSGNNVEIAVGLYMEHSGGGGGGAGGLGAAAAAPVQIRAPDETQTMRLMGDPTGGMGGGGGVGGGLAHQMLAHDPGYRAMVEMMDEQLLPSAFAAEPAAPTVDARRAVNAAAAAAADAEDDYVYDSDDENMREDDDDVDMGVARPPSLHDMFEPPKHLMHKAGGFQGARQVAKDSKRWLLVNIQSNDEFSSHALNRDVWRNDLVENLVREGFIFWQEVGLPREEGWEVPRYQCSCSHFDC
jgi:hypothetical protein